MQVKLLRLASYKMDVKISHIKRLTERKFQIFKFLKSICFPIKWNWLVSPLDSIIKYILLGSWPQYSQYWGFQLHPLLQTSTPLTYQSLSRETWIYLRISQSDLRNIIYLHEQDFILNFLSCQILYFFYKNKLATKNFKWQNILKYTQNH